MQKYEIIEKEVKTSAKGSPYQLVTLKGENGEVKASSFDLADKVIGDIVEGEIVVNGAYTNFKVPKALSGKSGGMTGVKEAQKRKEGMIEKSQDRKEDSIKIASTFRDATILTAAWVQKFPFPLPNEIEDQWLHYRKWLLSKYDVSEQDLNAPF